MADKSKIEWTDATWNPIRGCSVVSEGCRNCYAMQVAARFSGKAPDGSDLPYAGLAYRNESGAHWTGKVALVEKHLEDPLRWKKPRRIFVNSMSDLFHESVSDKWIDRIFAVMAMSHALSRGHVFQILTKRPERALEYLMKIERDPLHRIADDIAVFAGESAARIGISESQVEQASDQFAHAVNPDEAGWPLPNVWLGVSCEDQKTADERIPLLLQTPAAVRWVSAEPLLGYISFCDLTNPTGNDPIDAIGHPDPEFDLHVKPFPIDWVVVGGESGPGARPCALDWIEGVVRQCKSTGVPVFVKQLGAFVVSELRTAPADAIAEPSQLKPSDYASNGQVWAWRAGLMNKKGGDLDEFPTELQVRQYPAIAEDRV